MCVYLIVPRRIVATHDRGCATTLLSHFNHTEKAEGVAVGGQAQIAGFMYGQLEFFVGLPTVLFWSYGKIMDRREWIRLEERWETKMCEGETYNILHRGSGIDFRIDLAGMTATVYLCSQWVHKCQHVLRWQTWWPQTGPLPRCPYRSVRRFFAIVQITVHKYKVYKTFSKNV